MTPAALLLDLDGTLVDSEPLNQAAYAAFFRHRDWSVTDLTVFTGRRAEDVFATEPGPWAGADPLALSKEVAGFMPTDQLPVPMAGARELVLAAARLGHPLALVTSAGLPWVELALGRVLGVLDLFTTVVTAEDVEIGKPDPAGYRLATTRLGVPPAECVALEDTPAGIRAALGAGVVRTYGVGTTHPSAALREAGAVEVYAALPPLATLLSSRG